MRQEIITRTPSSYKTDTRTGYRVILRKAKMDKKQYLVLGDSYPTPFQKPGRILADNSKECTPYRSETKGIAENAVRRVKGGTATPTVQSGQMICGLYDGMLLLLAERARRHGRWVQFDAPLIPFGAKVSCKPIFSKDQARLHQFGIKMLPRIFMGYVLRPQGGWSGGLHIADCDARTCQPPRKTSNSWSTRKSHKEEICCFRVQTNVSNSSIFLISLEQDEKEEEEVEEEEEEEDGDTQREKKRTPFSMKSTVKTFCSMSGDIIYRHHEVHRTKL